MFDFVLNTSFKKDFKKLDKETQKFIRFICIPEILKNPLTGSSLKDKSFRGFLKFKAKFKSSQYRIIYKINNKEIIIIFIMVSSRENFYKQLKRRVD